MLRTSFEGLQELDDRLDVTVKLPVSVTLARAVTVGRLWVQFHTSFQISHFITFDKYIFINVCVYTCMYLCIYYSYKPTLEKSLC